MKKAGKKKGGFLLWTAVFAALLLLFDQLLLRVPLPAPGAREIQVFYRDFRQRLFALPEKTGQPASPPAPAAIKSAPRSPAAIPASPPPAPPPPASSRPAGAATEKTAADSRYIYADGEGNLQFADSLEEIPVHLRQEAKRLEH